MSVRSLPVGSAARRAGLRARGPAADFHRWRATGAARRQSGYFIVDPINPGRLRLFIAGVASMLRISRAKRDLISRAAEGDGSRKPPPSSSSSPFSERRQEKTRRVCPRVCPDQCAHANGRDNQVTRSCCVHLASKRGLNASRLHHFASGSLPVSFCITYT